MLLFIALVTASFVAISPSARAQSGKIYTACFQGITEQIFVCATDPTSGATTWIQTELFAGSFSVSRDGNHFAYLKQGSVYLSDIDASSTVAVGALPEGFSAARLALNADASKIAISGSAGLIVMNASTGSVSTISTHNLHSSFLEWSPNSDRLLYARPVVQGSAVFIVDADGSGVETQLIPPQNVLNMSADWSLDGKLIVVYWYDSLAGESNLVHIDVATGANTVIDITDYSDGRIPFGFDISPDGERIAFPRSVLLSGNTHFETNVWTMPVGGGPISKLYSYVYPAAQAPTGPRPSEAIEWTGVPDTQLFYSINVSNPEPEVGDEFDLVLTVTNEGANPVTDITASVERAQDSVGDADLVTGPEPASIPTLQAGASADITYRYKATVQGLLRLQISIIGEDSGVSVEASAKCVIPSGKTGSSLGACTDEIPISGDIVVNSTADGPDNDADDGGICSTGEKVMIDAETEADECTLRAAIQTANGRSGGLTRISFNIPSSDDSCDPSCRIIVDTPLDPISADVGIDASTQPGFAPELPVIILQAGAGAKSGVGLELGGNKGGIAGLVVTGFGEVGIKVTGNENVIDLNIVGKTKTALAPLSGKLGIWVKGGDDNRVGASSCDQSLSSVSNRLTGNSEAGILVSDGSTNTLVACNLIGPDFDSRLESNGTGIRIQESAANLIERNHVTKNAGIGVHIIGAPSVNNQVRENYVAENDIGVQIQSASSNTLGQKIESPAKNVNVISANTQVDVLIVSDDENAPANDNLVHRNAIGADGGLYIIENLETPVGLMIAGWAANNIIGPFFDEVGDYSNVIGGHALANVAIVGAHANGNRILSGLIGIGKGALDGSGLRGGSTSNIVVGLANDTQIGVGSSQTPANPSILLGLAGSNAILIEGSSSFYNSYPVVPGFPSVSGGSERSTGTTIQGVEFVGFRSPRLGTFLVAKRVDNLQLGPSVKIPSCGNSGAFIQDFKDVSVLGTTFRNSQDPACGTFSENASSAVSLCVGDGAVIGSSLAPSLRNEFSGFGIGVAVVSGGACTRADNTLTQNVRIENNLFGSSWTARNQTGVLLEQGASSVTVGGTEPGAGNVFLNNEKGIVLDGRDTREAPEPTSTLIQGNTFGIGETELDTGRNNTAIETRRAVQTRIGTESTATPANTVGRNLFANNRRVIAVFDPIEEQRGTTVFTNSIYDNRSDGVVGYDGILDLLQVPFRFPFVSVASIESEGNRFRVAGRITGRPDASYLIQFFTSGTCSGVNEGRDFVARYSEAANADGVIRIDHLVDAEDGDGLTVTATDLGSGTTGMFSQCYTIGPDGGLYVAEIDVNSSEDDLDGGGVLVDVEPPSGKSAVSDTLYVRAYETTPLGMNMSGTAATAHDGSSIIPTATIDRYWRIETGHSAQEVTIDLCMETGTLSEAEASSAVVIQRNRQASGRWIPFDSRVEMRAETTYVCASGLAPTGEFTLGGGNLTVISSPELTSPLDGATLDEGVSILQWGAVSGAVSYQAQVATSGSFDLLVADSSGLVSNSLAVTITDAFAPYFWRVRAQDDQDNWGPWSETWVFQSTYYPVATDDDLELPANVQLDQNYPNPFSHTTTIGFSLPEHSPVRIIVIDMLGHRVATLVDQPMAPGRHDVTLHAQNLASGIYFYRMEVGSEVRTERMVVLK